MAIARASGGRVVHTTSVPLADGRSVVAHRSGDTGPAVVFEAGMGMSGATWGAVVDDLAADLDGRSFEVARVAGGWMLRTRPAFAPAIRAASDAGGQDLDLREFDVAVLAAIAYHQPITRDGLKDIFGRSISRDLIGRLYGRGLIGTGPRSPRRGAPVTFVTTRHFLAAFDLESLEDLPEREQLEDAGMLGGAAPG